VKIIFAGTPDAAVPSLKALISREFDVVAVLTRPDSPQGRKKVMTPSPVAAVALEHKIPIIYENKIDDETQSLIDSFNPELGIVVAYGALLPQRTLDSVQFGWINLHFSSLPSWRGAAPVQWQIISGSQVAGSSVFSLIKELDAGDVFDTREYPIHADETSGELLERLAHLGAHQLLDVALSISDNTAQATQQRGDSSYARKLQLEDGHLTLTAPAAEVYNQYRGVSPEPGAFVLFEGERLKIFKARLAHDVQVNCSSIAVVEKKLFMGCQHGSLELVQVQPFSKQIMSAMDWFRGLRQEEVIVS
jgi:methionyl-tRNA formyltransferase